MVFRISVTLVKQVLKILEGIIKTITGRTIALWSSIINTPSNGNFLPSFLEGIFQYPSTNVGLETFTVKNQNKFTEHNMEFCICMEM